MGGGVTGGGHMGGRGIGSVGDASGGPTKSIDVWRGECLHNTIMAGLFLNQDHDIIGAKCCETISKV